MGNIAATATTDTHFFQYGFAAFKNGNATIRIGFGAVDSRKKTGSAAADNGNLHE